jgi:hypothetical protein
MLAERLRNGDAMKLAVGEAVGGAVDEVVQARSALSIDSVTIAQMAGLL